MGLKLIPQMMKGLLGLEEPEALGGADVVPALQPYVPTPPLLCACQPARSCRTGSNTLCPQALSRRFHKHTIRRAFQPHFPDQKTNTQKGKLTCVRSHCLEITGSFTGCPSNVSSFQNKPFCEVYSLITWYSVLFPIYT